MPHLCITHTSIIILLYQWCWLEWVCVLCALQPVDMAKLFIVPKSDHKDLSERKKQSDQITAATVLYEWVTGGHLSIKKYKMVN